MAAIEAQLSQVFTRYPEIQAVYLFGSHATGKLHSDSDLDLAIVPRDRNARSRKLEILTELARAGFDQVDLVFLDSDDLVLKYEATKHNHLVYLTNDFDPGSFFSKIVRQYLDFQPYLKAQRKAYQQRILDGQQGSHPKTSQPAR